MTSSDKRWDSVKVDESCAKRLAGDMGLSLPVAKVLVSRGFRDPAGARSFLSPRLSDLSDPFELTDMERAAARIWKAIDNRELIVVFGDFDADGVTATAALVQVLRQLGGQVQPFLPKRITDGYGLSVSAVNRCLDTLKPDLIVTVDSGVCSTDAVLSASKRGVDVVVTDHHEISEELAPAVAVVNPKRGPDGPARQLAGVGVSFKLCHALVKYGMSELKRDMGHIDLRDYLDIVAVGTVADVVPLVGENRILVRYGLDALSKNGCPGLEALKRRARIRGKVDCYHIGFVIGPRLNAPGRVGDADPALQLLMSTDAAEADMLADRVEKANSRRKTIEDGIAAEAQTLVERYFDDFKTFGLVAAGDGWHVGLIGIVASKLSARFNRPALVISFDENGEGRGSGRSIDGVDLVKALKECSDLLEGYGGHPMAAGLSINKRNLGAFAQKFDDICAEQLKGSDLRPLQKVDAWISLSEVDDSLHKDILSLRPLGLGNPTPVWGARNVSVLGRPRTMSKNTLKMLVAAGGTQLPAVGFGLADRQVPAGKLDMLFQIRENTYGGNTSLQLSVRDFRAATDL